MSIKGLEKITDKILDEARAEATRILNDATDEANKIRAEQVSRAQDIRTRLSEEAEREGNELIARAKAAAANQRKNAMLAAQSAVVDEVFASALAEIEQLDDDKYTELMAGLLAAAMLEQVAAEKACDALGDDEEIVRPERYEVLMNSRDRERVSGRLLPLVCKKLKGKVAREKTDALVISAQNAAIGGGLILRCGDIEINCSLSLLFAQLREELEGEVSCALFQPEQRA